MHSKLLRAFLYVLLAAAPVRLLAQSAPVRWGKLTPEEIKLTRCAFDSTATAVVLADYGQIKLGYGNVLIERHRRIKILDRKGIGQANISIPYYTKNDLEKVTSLQAQTLNVDAKGKVTETEVPGKQQFDVDASENWREKRFTFANVEPGSILEYRYTTVSENFFFLDAWLFQSDIPTLHSELRVFIPEGLDYRVLMQGRKLIGKYAQASGSQWALSNVPALREESHVANHLDYAEKIRFQLAGYKRASNSHPAAGSEYVTTMTSWEKLATELLENETITRYLNRRGMARDVLSTLYAPADPELVRLQKIYNHVSHGLQWNGTHRILTDQPLNALLDKKQGSSAEINLYLTLLLREAGIQANPVLLSTRQHGKVHVTYPLLSQFNHLIACAQIDGKELLLDATDRMRPYHLLADDDLNENAFLLDKEKPRWVQAKANSPTRQTNSVEVDLNDPAKPLYRFSVRYEGYLALDKRLQFAKKGNKALANEVISNENQEFKLINAKVEHADDPDEALLATLSYQPEEGGQAQPSMVYFNPVLLNEFTENPFKQEQRFLPVELDYPQTRTYILNLKVPAGYQVQEMPKSVLMKFPGELAEFRYQVNRQNDLIQLLTTVNFKSSVIPSEYYDHLREFYDQIISKYREAIVFKKQ
ncbi:MAG TPA: DUF3857 domain-containing protein [Cytophagales bacterium]